MAIGTPDWWSRTRALLDMDFTDLRDTPGTYGAEAGKAVIVVVTEDGVVFSETIIDNHSARHESGGADELDLSDLPGSYTDAQARAAINDIFGADGKADADIDLDSHILRKVAHVRVIPRCGLLSEVDNEYVVVTGSTTSAAASYIQIYGKTHATKPNVIEFYLAEVLKAYFDADGVFHLVEQPSMTWNHKAQHESGGADEIDLTDMIPGDHAARHESGGDDEISLEGLDPSSGWGFAADYVKVSDVKAYNVAGGTFTSGAWRIRVINTED
ncbi:unnamed protein product, partial [marine sediment metagenome]